MSNNPILLNLRGIFPNLAIAIHRIAYARAARFRVIVFKNFHWLVGRTVAAYCPSRLLELMKKNMTKHSRTTTSHTLYAQQVTDLHGDERPSLADGPIFLPLEYPLAIRVLLR